MVKRIEEHGNAGDGGAIREDIRETREALRLAKVLARNTVVTASGCHEWQRHRVTGGYGQVKAWGKMRRAHRVAWSLLNGEIPPGAVILHKCDNPPCVNPEHLSLGTHHDNVHDAIAKGRHVNRDDWRKREARSVGLSGTRSLLYHLGRGRSLEELANRETTATGRARVRCGKCGAYGHNALGHHRFQQA